MNWPQNNLKTNNTKFLKLMSDNTVKTPLKTYCDTVLFYYLGSLASSNSTGDIVEIGVGGSTYPLIELTETCDKTFVIIDHDKQRLEHYSSLTHWPNARLKKVCTDIKEINKRQLGTEFSYCHIDADKNFIRTMLDIEFCLDQLAPNGLICQDDYGNHKWPTVTDAVKDLEFRGKIKLIMVGDASVWFTKPEYYDYWMSLLNNNYEYSLLTALCNISNSEMLDRTPGYFYMNACANSCRKDDYSQLELDYFNTLIQLESTDYLQMPHTGQSKFGMFFTMDNDSAGYLLTDVYSKVKGDDWPSRPPVTKKEIEQLPDWIKFELKSSHNINIYEKILKKSGIQYTVY